MANVPARNNVAELRNATRLSRVEMPKGAVSMQDILRRVRDLPALPNVVVRILRMTGIGESYTPRQLAEVIAQDPSFSARILKMANSALYGLPRSVSAISDAVMMLGSHSIRNLAMLTATHDTLRCRIMGYELKPGQLWRHSVACAFVVDELAEGVNYPNREEAFVAGLLHDVGKLVLGFYVKERIQELREYVEQEQVTFTEAERAILGYDHAEVGGCIAAHWNLPPTLSQAIARHHEPFNGELLAPLTALVHTANAICDKAGLGTHTTGMGLEIDANYVQALGLTANQVEEAILGVARNINHLKSL